MRRVAVYCGSNPGTRPAYGAAARRLGAELGARRLGLVYGGGNVGLMGILADAALAAGGEVIGVIPRALQLRELAHPRLTELRVVRSMHERKALMAELADGFVALPGGLGTLEEMFEILTWAQLGMHTKPAGLLNVCHYYDNLLDFVNHAVREQFVKPEHGQMLQVDGDAAVLLAKMDRYEAPKVGKLYQ